MVNRVVTKVLAGIEDLLLGTGTVTQTRGGVSKTITKIDASGLIYENSETLRTRFGKKVEVLDNVAAMQALVTNTAAETFVYLLGYTTKGDGGGGLFWLDTTDTTSTEDLNIVFNPDTLSNGRWKRADTSDQMSPDRGDADYTIQAFDFGIQLFNTTLTANRTVILPTTGLYKGRSVAVLRGGGGAFNLLIGSIATLTGVGKVELVYDGSTWVLVTEPSLDSSIEDSFNGSFEADSNNDSIPNNWAINEQPLATISLDTTDSAHGLQSIKFLSGGNGGGSVTSEQFSVLKSETRVIEFTYKASAIDILFKIEVNTYNLAGTLVSTLTAYSEGAANPLVYTTKVVSIVIDSTAVTADIVITGIDETGTNTVAGTNCHVDNVKHRSLDLLDEDDMVSDSSILGATQQSIKALIEAKTHTGVYFNAIADNAAFTVVSLSVVSVEFGNVIDDIGSDYNAATDTFTAPVNGVYAFYIGQDYTRPAASNNLGILIRLNVNGSDVPDLYNVSPVPAANTDVTSDAFVIKKLNAGDEVKVRINNLSDKLLTVSFLSANRFAGLLLLKL